MSKYILNTSLLVAMVTGLSGIIGISTAWLCSSVNFPLRDFLRWMLILPMAAPAYVVAYAYTDILDYSGPIQTQLRLALDLNINPSYFPEIRSMPGAVLILSLVLYPYVYLISLSVFQNQVARFHDSASVLGASPYKIFTTITLPTARPAIAGGLALVAMETVADYGVVQHLGIPTFATGIMRSWMSLSDLTTALQLSAVLFTVVLVLIVSESTARRGQVHNPVVSGVLKDEPELLGWKKFAAFFVCATPVVFGFFLPICLLLYYAATQGDQLLGKSFYVFVKNSFSVAGITAILITILGVWLSYANRVDNGKFMRLVISSSTLGYALPGTIIAIGTITIFTNIDLYLARQITIITQKPASLLITGTISLLIFAYVVRFLTVGYNACNSGLEKINKRYDEISYNLGKKPLQIIQKVHLPLILPAVTTSFLLVFIDVTKELPATLILRPFNFETLATRVYRLASDERLFEASTAALCIVFLGLIPTLIIAKRIFNNRPARR